MDQLGLTLPVIAAPMGGVTGGWLAAAVSEAGGLGIVGAGYGDLDWVRRELDEVVRRTTRPWGVGFITWSLARRPEVLDLALAYRPAVVMFSFGDPAPFVDRAHARGALVFCQVQTVAMAREAVAAGADVVVAQGTEAGGHGARRATLPLVPAVVDAVAPHPVVAAGGIADGRTLAAALVLGAQAAVVGTRLYASAEALAHPRLKQRLVEVSGDMTERTRIFDIVRGLNWPAPFTGRAVTNAFWRRWHERPEALAAAREAVAPAFEQAQAAGDPEEGLLWAGEGVDLVRAVEPAAVIVRRMAAEAEAVLAALAAPGDGGTPSA
ncbi:MAG: nitronate monooxygenase [Actinomycetia bacterium]|nr:nitronate monooxygenase [Actinomycetes bacterium]